MNDDLAPTGTPQPATGGKRPGGKTPGGKQLAPGTAPRQEVGKRHADETPEPSDREDRRRQEDEKLDQALKGTFPASDPFSI